jgi:hypothetical protein
MLGWVGIGLGINVLGLEVCRPARKKSPTIEVFRGRRKEEGRRGRRRKTNMTQDSSCETGGNTASQRDCEI